MNVSIKIFLLIYYIPLATLTSAKVTIFPYNTPISRSKETQRGSESLKSKEEEEKEHNHKIIHRQKRQAIYEGAEKWPKRIAYSDSSGRGEDVKQAIHMWQDYSCLSFYEDSEANPRILFRLADVNNSHMGMRPEEDGAHIIQFQSITQVGSIAHELGHAFGFTHAHQRHDRNEHVEIEMDKVNTQWKFAYELEENTETFGLPYDYGSIMHYDPTVPESGTDELIMEAKEHAYMHAMGQRFHPTFVDILMLNKYYQCEDVCEDMPNKCKFDGFPNPKNCAKCICPSGFGGDTCDGLPSSCGEILKTSSSPLSFEQYVGSQQAFMQHPPSYGHFFPPNFGQYPLPPYNGQYILPAHHAMHHNMPASSWSSNPNEHFPGAAHYMHHQQHHPQYSNFVHPSLPPPSPPSSGFNLFPGFLKRRKRNNNSIDYGQGMEQCHWHIKAPPGNRIKLSVTSLTAFCIIACKFGFVELKIRKDMRPTGIRLCCTEDLNENGQLTLYSESNLVIVSLYSKIGQVGLTMQYSHFSASTKLPSSLIGKKPQSLLSRKTMLARTKLPQMPPSSLLTSLPKSILSGHGKTLATSLVDASNKTSLGAKTNRPSSLVVNNSLAITGKRSGGGIATSLLAAKSGTKLPSSLLVVGANGGKTGSMPSSLLVDGKNVNTGKKILPSSLLADSIAPGTMNNGNLYAPSLVAENNSMSGRRKGVPSLLKILTEKSNKKFVPSLLEKIDEKKK